MDATDNTCLVCHEATEIFAFGRCDHPICFKCSTRMRALCEHYYCPICRTDLPEVYFMFKVEKFGEMPIKKFIPNKRYKIQYENEEIQQKVSELLEHKCTTCQQRPPEKTFKALRDHMRRVHSLFYCDLCLALKIFTRERKLYDRQALATHRRVGDKDDTSYKGHPLCRFCDERYLDNDELYKHLRKDHYFCHFCESIGSQEYYADYDFLRDHFRKDHYLCEEGECATVQFENAFKSEIDLKGHRATHHSKGHSKQQCRQERTLNIDINLVPRPSSRPARGGAGRGDHQERTYQSSNRGRGRYGDRGANNRDQADIDRAIQASLSTMKEEEVKKSKPSVEKSKEKNYVMSSDQFPTLGGQPVASMTSGTTSTTSSAVSDSVNSSLADRFAIANSMSVQHGVLGQNDFPSLATVSAVPRTIVEDFPALKSSAKPTVSVPRPTSRQTNSAQSKSSNKPGKPANTFKGSTRPIQDDFPELPVKKPPQPSLASWVTPASSTSSSDVSSNKSSVPQKKSKLGKAKGVKGPVASNFVDDDFPTLGRSSNVSYTDKWFKSSKTNGVIDMDDKEVPDNWDDDNDATATTTTDIIDRYSPVNIPKSPETNKKSNKNKKKKKKEKPVTELKNASETLKNNSSLDDIASLLMSSSKPLLDAMEKPTATGDAPNQIGEKQTNRRHDPKSNDIDFKEIPVSTKNTASKDEIPSHGKDADALDHFASPSKFSEENFQIAETQVFKPKPKFSIAENDFPSLGSAGSKTAPPPPGFKKPKPTNNTNVPPGLSKPTAAAKPPPPGFSGPKLADVSKEMFPSSFSTKKDVIPMSSDPTNFDYVQPDGFSDRNKMLIEKVQAACVSPAQFGEFKTISGAFRRSDLSSEDYYLQCEIVLGKKKFADIFPELLALLPDIRKQQDLLSVFMVKEGFKKDDSVLKISGKSQNAKGAWTSTSSGFLTCQTCKQVLVRKDYNKHLASHTLDSQEFPTLGDTVPTGKGGWSAIR